MQKVRMKQFLVYNACILSLLFSPCMKKASAGDDRINVTVSILPQKYFVEKLGGSMVDVNVMIPPGHSPATYEPSIRQMNRLYSSKIYFSIGHIPFESAWMKKIISVNKSMKIYDTSAGAELISSGSAHSHGHEGDDHEYEVHVNPHIWLSPREVKSQAHVIFRALSEFDPDNTVLYKKNYEEFILELDKLDKRIREILSGLKKRKFIVYHPSWGYFARDYGLEEIPVEMDGKNPTAYHIRTLVDLANREDIRVIFIQSQFDTSQARTIANEIKGTVVKIDPLAEDWPGNMKKVSEAFRKALE